MRHFNNGVVIALTLAAITAILSAFAGVYIEIVLKNGGDDQLWQRQFHLYLGASLVSLVPFLVSKFYFGKKSKLMW